MRCISNYDYEDGDEVVSFVQGRVELEHDAWEDAYENAMQMRDWDYCDYLLEVRDWWYRDAPVSKKMTATAMPLYPDLETHHEGCY